MNQPPPHLPCRAQQAAQRGPSVRIFTAPTRTTERNLK